MYIFTKGQALYIDDIEFSVIRGTPLQIQLENQVTGEFRSESFLDLMTMYAEGRLHTSRTKLRWVRRAQERDEPLHAAEAGEAALADGRRKSAYVVGILQNDADRKGAKCLAETALVICASLGDLRPPHVSTLYAWLREYKRANGDASVLISNFDARGGRGRPRLHPLVEEAIDNRIETVLLEARAGSAEKVHQGVLLDIEEMNDGRIASERLKPPSLRTVQRRIAYIWAYDFAKARFGREEADRRFGMYLGSRRATRILEIVEIDHTPLDIMVLDETGTALRPWVTVVLDRKSRCVLGLHISLSGHGTAAVFECLRHALMPKLYLAEGGAYADLGLEWPIFGWFQLIVMDNGREFHANAVVEALLKIGICAEFAPSKEPNAKPHVERFIKTLNYMLIHTLPGTTLAKAHKRIGFKPEEEACLSLEQLDRMVHLWICEEYHTRPHKGLAKRTPISVWKEDAQAHPPQLKFNHDDVEIEFSNIRESCVQPYGIDLNNFVYVSTRLLMLRRMLPDGQKVTVRWPSHDAGHIWVWDERGSDYFKVNNKDERYAGMTVEQAKAAKFAKAISEADPRHAHKAAMAADRIREEARDAKGLRRANDAKARRERKAAHKQAGTGSQQHRSERFKPVARNAKVRWGPVDDSSSAEVPDLAVEDIRKKLREDGDE